MTDKLNATSLHLPFRKRRRGSVALEFMMVAPFLIWLTFAIAEYGMALNYLNTQNQLTRDGARYAAIHATETTAYQAGTVVGSIRNFVEAEAKNTSLKSMADSNILIGQVTIGSSGPGTFTVSTPTTPGQNVAVKTSVDYSTKLWGAKVVPGISNLQATPLSRQAAFIIERPSQ